MYRSNGRATFGLYGSTHDPDVLAYAAAAGFAWFDTAFNYFDFQSHRVLGADRRLGRIQISTKIGFFQGPSGAEHSLEPARLQAAIERTALDLGREPDALLLHNPEHTLAAVPEGSGSRFLEDALGTLHDACARGLCGTWGLSTWDSRELLQALNHPTLGHVTCPTVMVRAGLLVSARQMLASESLFRLLETPYEGRWGMSPFGGSFSAEFFRHVHRSPWLAEGVTATAPEIAFRLAFDLPSVARVAVGSSDRAHMRALLEAVELELHPGVIARYRELLGGRETRDQDD